MNEPHLTASKLDEYTSMLVILSDIRDFSGCLSGLAKARVSSSYGSKFHISTSKI